VSSLNCIIIFRVHNLIDAPPLGNAQARFVPTPADYEVAGQPVKLGGQLPN
jgi:hypothetical protein